MVVPDRISVQIRERVLADRPRRLVVRGQSPFEHEDGGHAGGHHGRDRPREDSSSIPGKGEQGQWEQGDGRDGLIGHDAGHQKDETGAQVDPGPATAPDPTAAERDRRQTENHGQAHLGRRPPQSQTVGHGGDGEKEAHGHGGHRREAEALESDHSHDGQGAHQQRRGQVVPEGVGLEEPDHDPLPEDEARAVTGDQRDVKLLAGGGGPVVVDEAGPKGVRKPEGQGHDANGQEPDQRLLDEPDNSRTLWSIGLRVFQRLTSIGHDGAGWKAGIWAHEGQANKAPREQDGRRISLFSSHQASYAFVAAGRSRAISTKLRLVSMIGTKPRGRCDDARGHICQGHGPWCLLRARSGAARAANDSQGVPAAVFRIDIEGLLGHSRPGSRPRSLRPCRPWWLYRSRRLLCYLWLSHHQPPVHRALPRRSHFPGRLSMPAGPAGFFLPPPSSSLPP